MTMNSTMGPVDNPGIGKPALHDQLDYNPSLPYESAKTS
jgi:hypothetical protein